MHNAILIINHGNVKYDSWSNVYLWVILAAVSCHEPENLTNGDRIGMDFTFMKTIHYLCHPGYRLNGSRTRTCSANGTWTGSSPTCVQHFFYGNCLLSSLDMYIFKLIDKIMQHRPYIRVGNGLNVTKLKT